jgi:hypothetical protein
MRCAGIPPDNIVVVDNVVANPLHASAGVPIAFATHVRGVSALAFWKLSDGRGIVEDVSGIVEWRTSDASIARVDDTFSYWPETSHAMAATGRFVSPWFARLYISQADKPFTVTAAWIQKLGDSEPTNTLAITQPADQSLSVPPALTCIQVTPGRFVYTSAAQLNGRAFGATGGLSDKTAVDMTNTVTWSLLEVQVDAFGHETGTIPVSPAVAAISQGGPLTAGGILSVTPAAGQPARRLRLVATDPVTGRVGTADILLQF